MILGEKEQNGIDSVFHEYAQLDAVDDRSEESLCVSEVCICMICVYAHGGMHVALSLISMPQDLSLILELLCLCCLLACLLLHASLLANLFGG